MTAVVFLYRGSQPCEQGGCSVMLGSDPPMGNKMNAVVLRTKLGAHTHARKEHTHFHALVCAGSHIGTESRRERLINPDQFTTCKHTMTK